MNTALAYLALALVEFLKGVLVALVASGLSGLDATAAQTILVGALMPALSVVLVGVDKLRTHLLARTAS